jgi:hypothetical protein
VDGEALRELKADPEAMDAVLKAELGVEAFGHRARIRKALR